MAKMDKDGNVAFQPEELTPPDSVDYFIYRTDVAREHTHAKRWMIAFFVAFGVFVATNIYWIWNEMQYVDEEITMTQEATTDGGGDAIISGTAAGDVYYGESTSNNKGQETDPQDGR